MAVTITNPEVAVAIRAATSVNDIPGPISTVLSFLVPAASAMLIQYAPNAPDAVHNASLIRLAGWLYDADPTDARISEALTVSGAANLLHQWRVHRAIAIGGVADEPAPAPAPSPTPGAGLPTWPTTGRYVLQVIDGVLTWVEFPGP